MATYADGIGAARTSSSLGDPTGRWASHRRSSTTPTPLDCSSTDGPSDGRTASCPSTSAGVEGIGGEEEEQEGPPHYALGLIRPLTITAGEPGAAFPESESRVTARDYDFDVNVKAGPQTVTFVNEGPGQVHHAVFFPFKQGIDQATAEQVLGTFLASEEEEAPATPRVRLRRGRGEHH